MHHKETDCVSGRGRRNMLCRSRAIRSTTFKHVARSHASEAAEVVERVASKSGCAAKSRSKAGGATNVIEGRCFATLLARGWPLSGPDLAASCFSALLRPPHTSPAGPGTPGRTPTSLGVYSSLRRSGWPRAWQQSRALTELPSELMLLIAMTWRWRRSYACSG